MDASNGRARPNITASSQSREAASSLGRRRNGRPDRRSHFSGSTKIPGNEPVLQSGQGLNNLLVAARTRCQQTMTSDHAEVSHEASNTIRNHSRHPSHCRNHRAVVACTFDRASCRRYGHRSLQEFSQPDRRKGFRTIASLSVNNALRRPPTTPSRSLARRGVVCEPLHIGELAPCGIFLGCVGSQFYLLPSRRPW